MDPKRKVNGGSTGAADADDRAAKRRKLPSDDTSIPFEETPETTTEYGLRFLDTVKKTVDKAGRNIATAFLTLPNKRQLPDYYKFTKLPIALDTIEEKLVNRKFPTLTSLEGDFKRMISNAKEYNQKGSVIYEDAERMRKVLSNFMTKNNPVYITTPGFVTTPTPLPVEGVAGNEGAERDREPEVEAEPQPSAAKRSRGRPPKNPQAHALRNSMTPATELQYAGVGYSGLNFQQAQEKIMEDIINYQEDPKDEIPAFGDFIELPPRSLKDYYRTISYPVSLAQIQKRVKGSRGKNDSSGVSDFKTWAAFEEEFSHIWNNAWHYNEDGSEISERAKQLQTFFYKELQEAKQAVPESAGPKIKLKMSNPEPTPRITLKFAGKASPRDSPAPQPNGSSNNAIPVNGTGRRNPFGGSHASATPVPSLDQLERARSVSGSAASPTPSNAAPVKTEDVARNSPATAPGHRSGSQAVATPGLNGSTMLPPSTPGLPHLHTQTTPSGYAQSFNHNTQYPTANLGLDSKWRPPGKTAADAMITNLSIATHPGLNISKHLRMDVPPSPTMTQQSITIHLPSTHYYLQIKPTIAASLLERQHKLFVTSGTQRLHTMPTIPGHSADPRRPLFEARLLPGVNRIEIELIAALPKGAPKPANGLDAELEKITVFANLLR